MKTYRKLLESVSYYFAVIRGYLKANVIWPGQLLSMKISYFYQFLSHFIHLTSIVIWDITLTLALFLYPRLPWVLSEKNINKNNQKK